MNIYLNMEYNKGVFMEKVMITTSKGEQEVQVVKENKKTVWVNASFTKEVKTQEGPITVSYNKVIKLHKKKHNVTVVVNE